MSITISGTDGITFPDNGQYAQASGSNGQSGFQKLPNGMIIQWGVSPVIGSNAAYDITYPTPFPFSAFVAIATAFGTNYSTAEYALQTSLTNNSSFKITNPNGTQRAAFWIALGR